MYWIQNRTERYPALNVYREENDLLVTAEIAGVHPENLEIELEKNTLKISGNRQVPVTEARAERSEIWTGEFRRQVQLNEEVDAEKISAEVKDGILLVRLPLSEKARSRKIAVKAANRELS